LDGTPGINRRIAEVIVAEAGTEMNRFRTEHHFASWIGVCPGQNESAGKRKSGKTRKGNRSLRAGSRSWCRAQERELLRLSIPAHCSPARQKRGPSLLWPIL
jgi:transposase